MTEPTDDPRHPGEKGRVSHRTLGAPEKTVKLARKLRKAMSLPEVLLWRELKGKPLGMKFRKQFGVLNFVADFACVEVRLLVEIDGIAHDMGDRPERDERRTEELECRGWQVIRIPATEVLKDANAVAQSIVTYALSLKHPPRNGEVAARRADRGAEAAPHAQRQEDSSRPLRPFGGPPRAGEDLA